jgi:hypothetical protein
MIYPEINFKPKLQVINADQITQIHLATLELLERTGSDGKTLELDFLSCIKKVSNRHIWLWRTSSK